MLSIALKWTILILIIILLIINLTIISNQLYQTPIKTNHKLIKLGRRQSKKRRLLVGGLVKNCAASLPYIYQKLTSLSQIFEWVEVIIFENDSTDLTRHIILDWSKQLMFPNVNIRVVNMMTYVCGEKQVECKDWDLINTGIGKNRIERMAYLRNRLNKYLCSLANNYDYVLLTDLDLKGNWVDSGIYSTIGHFETNSNLQVVGFRGTTKQGNLWDPYALEAYGSKHHFFHTVSAVILSRMFPRNSGLYRVNSTFSGGIFIRASEMSEKYRYCLIKILPRMYQCEHISYLHNFDQVYINTDMIMTVK